MILLLGILKDCIFLDVGVWLALASEMGEVEEVLRASTWLTLFPSGSCSVGLYLGIGRQKAEHPALNGYVVIVKNKTVFKLLRFRDCFVTE